MVNMVDHVPGTPELSLARSIMKPSSLTALSTHLRFTLAPDTCGTFNVGAAGTSGVVIVGWLDGAESPRAQRNRAAVNKLSANLVR